VRLPSILVLRVSRALELRIGLRAELRAELQGGDPLGPPCALRAPFYCIASTLGGQRCCKAFGRAFGRAFVKLRTELRAELLQGFGRALCFKVRHVYSAGRYCPQLFLDQLKAGLAGV
jgi:hypothetical protein